MYACKPATLKIYSRPTSLQPPANVTRDGMILAAFYAAKTYDLHDKISRAEIAAAILQDWQTTPVQVETMRHVWGEQSVTARHKAYAALRAANPGLPETPPLIKIARWGHQR